MDGQGVAQAVRSLERDGQSTSAHPGLKSAVEAGGLECPGGARDPQEYLALRKRWTPVSKVGEECGAHLRGQRQHEGRTHLAPWHPQLAAPPLDVVKLQRCNLTRAQAVSDDEQEHGVVTPSLGRRTVDGSQERADRLPGQGARKSLA